MTSLFASKGAAVAASCNATYAPVIEAVRVPPSAWSTSQSRTIWRSAKSAPMSQIARSELADEALDLLGAVQIDDLALPRAGHPQRGRNPCSSEYSAVTQPPCPSRASSAAFVVDSRLCRGRASCPSRREPNPWSRTRCSRASSSTRRSSSSARPVAVEPWLAIGSSCSLFDFYKRRYPHSSSR